jgi:DNA-entry nuclease
VFDLRIAYGSKEQDAGWREDFAPNSDPVGWGENRIVSIKLYNGKKYKGYLWNRSHLIADSLGGKAIRKNLITGTRMQNVGANDGTGGMAYTERKAVNL